MLDMIEIGAGGGSIAHLNDLGLPAVGPRSAGSSPGPACYGLGGEEPTVTDADLLLGYLNPNAFAQGTMQLDLGAAQVACERLAGRLDLDAGRMAWGIHQLVNENMAAAARVHAAERGLDTRAYALVATGGAGPVHACGVAQRLGLQTVVVPPLAGVGSAFGFFLAPISFDFTRSYLVRLQQIERQGPELDTLNRILGEQEEEGRAIVTAAGVSPSEIGIQRSVDMRYVGQGYEIRVPFPAGAVDDALVAAIRGGFEREYERFYGRLCDGVPIQAVNWRVVVSGPTIDLRDLASDGASMAESQTDSRPSPESRPALFDRESDRVDTPVWQRSALVAGFRERGPLIIEEPESTAVVPPGWGARLHGSGCLVLEAS